VLTIDDDIIIKCEDLSFLLHTWLVNQRVIVGISPRIHRYDAESGDLRYLNWQYTWWNGAYSIVLTKASVMHRSYILGPDPGPGQGDALPGNSVPIFDRNTPPRLLSFIDEQRNCEDLAIAHQTTREARAAPVWASVLYYDVANGGISSGGAAHFQKR
jgi:hypothetical protein